MTSIIAAHDFAAHFSLVMIDEKTEKHLGNFPYDRSIYAQAIDACADYEAKAVILKFFIDLPKSEIGDSKLKEAMIKIPVILQARLNAPDGTKRKIPKEFALTQQDLTPGYSGKTGWIPLSKFMETAHGIGFVDFNTVNQIPLIEEYGDTLYPSLILHCLELATGNKAVFSGQNKVEFGERLLSVNESNIYAGKIETWEPVEYLSLIDLIQHKLPRHSLKGKIVILGWDTSQTPTIETEHGPKKIHQLFSQCLAAVYNDLINK
ncbi:MAG: CHASE2 domain-containing protein [Verrucomicrobiota bacterium]